MALGLQAQLIVDLSTLLGGSGDEIVKQIAIEINVDLMIATATNSSKFPGLMNPANPNGD